MSAETRAPSLQTAAAMAAAMLHLEAAERIAARRNFDKWSTGKLVEARAAVRLAHFNNTPSGEVDSLGHGPKEAFNVTAGFAAQDAAQD